MIQYWFPGSPAQGLPRERFESSYNLVFWYELQIFEDHNESHCNLYEAPMRYFYLLLAGNCQRKLHRYPNHYFGYLGKLSAMAQDKAAAGQILKLERSKLNN